MIPAWAIRTKADEEAIKQGCAWDDAKGDAIITFAKTFFKPQFISGKFSLLEWQERFLRSLYSWRLPDGNRRFRTANLHIAKKNGKTLLVGIISAFELLRSEDPSPFIATASVSKENASQVFNEIKHTLTKAKLAKHCKITPTQKRILVPTLNSEYRSLASDGDTAQGYNISTCVIDEAHAHKNASLYDSLKYATIARPNGLLVIISTAGDDVTQFYHSIYSKSKRILAGDDLDPTHYAEVYEAEAEAIEADPLDEAQWKKANPSLGTSFSTASFRADLLAAQKDPAEWNRFKRYRLNLFVRPDEAAYFSVADWDKWKELRTDDQLKSLDCWIGVDLSQTTDPSSICALWHLGDRKFYAKTWAWVARAGFMKREEGNLPTYNQFADEGSMVISDGDRIDDKAIYRHILDMTRKFKVKAVTFDPTSAFVLMSNLEEERVTCLRMPQTYQYYDGPMKALNTAILEGRVRHDGSQWLRYCLSNIRISENERGEIRPHKKKSIDKIDGAIALLMAFSQAASAPVEVKKSVYDTRGIVVF